MKTDRASREKIPDKLYFKIGEASRIADLPSSVLRFWETEFSQIKPKRTPSGQRLYRKHELELILLIKDLLYNKKYTIQGAKRHLRKLDKRHQDPSSALDEIRTELEHIRDLLA